MKLVKEKIAKTVRKLRGEKSLLDVAFGTKISEKYLRQIEHGKANLTIEILNKLAVYFGIDLVQLFGYEKNPRPIIEVKADDHFVSVPLLADPASLGMGLEIDETEVLEEPCLIHKRILKKGHDYRAIFVKGDSMSPVLNDGDIVAIDVKDRNPEKLKGKLVACHTGDFEVTIKSLRVYKDKFYFKALNLKWEEENSPMLTPKKDGLILGKVVWAWKKFE